MLTVFDVTIASPPLRRLAVFTAAALIAAPLSAQSPPRTPDGHPDLQGTWNFSSLTPLERPAQFVDKPVLTATEAAEFERQTLERIDADRVVSGNSLDTPNIVRLGLKGLLNEWLVRQVEQR